MRTYYFDVKDGVPTRDRKGLKFPNAVGAIAHSKELAQLLRHDPRLKDRSLSIVVVTSSAPRFIARQFTRTRQSPASPLRRPDDGQVGGAALTLAPLLRRHGCNQRKKWTFTCLVRGVS